MKKQSLLQKSFLSFEKLLFPPKPNCIGCGSMFEDEVEPKSHDYVRALNLCQRCESMIEPISGYFCNHCGRRTADKTPRCHDCTRDQERLLKGNRSAFHYSGLVIDLLSLYKFRGKESLSIPLGNVMSRVVLTHYKHIKFDSIVYVPLHTERHYERGFNQSELLATEISKVLRIPLLHGLERVKPTMKQSKLGRLERITTLSDAIISTLPNNIQNKTFLLVDDVYTTGATGEACAKALKHLNIDLFMVTLAR